MADGTRTELAAQLGQLQELDDALAYRLSRIAVPCPDCEAAGEGRCDDHARDLDLIEAYRKAHAAASSRMSAARMAARHG